jgi:hypothetical protein
MSLGIIVAGLSPEDFSSLNDVALGGVTPSAVKHLTSEHLKLLTQEKLRSIPLESLSLLRTTQLKKNGNNLLDKSTVKFKKSYFLY